MIISNFSRQSNRIGALLLIDCYSHYLFGQTLPSKKKGDIQSACNKLLRQSKGFAVIQADGEFTYMDKYFESKNTRLSIKVRGQKASVVENAIRTVKRRLYSIMRVKGVDWPSRFQCMYICFVLICCAAP